MKMNSRLKETESKWNCEYCTYENWPSSLKCTMCRGAKPLLGEDIYRLRIPSPQRSGSSVASGPVPHSTDSYNVGSQNCSKNVPSGGKWSCEVCTYLNYQNTTRCVQCGNRKSPNNTQFIHSVASNLHEQLAPLRLGDPPPNTGSNSQFNPPAINLHPERYSNPPNVVAEKWSCFFCTYENWPKSTKCIMCGHQKEKDKRDKSSTNLGLISPSPERDHSQKDLPSPPHTPYVYQAQRDENLAIARRFVIS